MPLTLVKCRNRLNHVLGGDPSSEFEVDDLINEAGREFCGAHQWKFLERAPELLDLTASQAYVDLPSDFEQLLHIESTEEFGYSVREVDYGTFATYQAAGSSSILGGLIVCVVHPTQTAASSAPAAPRLLVWPTPSATTADALRIYYRAGWTTLTADQDVPNIPTYCDTALTQFINAVAQGYEEPDGGSVWERLDRIKQSKSFEDLVYRSGLAQGNYGPEANGAMAGSGAVEFYSNVPASPS